MNIRLNIATALTAGALLCSLTPAKGVVSLQAEDCTYDTSSYCPSSCGYAIEAEFRALFLQPTSSNLCYAAEAVPLPLPSPNWKIYDIKPDYHFGFDIGFYGRECDGNSELMLNWTHFDSKDSASKTVASDDMIGPFFEIGSDAEPYKSARGHVTFNFDEVNLDWGVLCDFGDFAHVNLFAGIGGARIHQKLSSHFSNLDGTIVRKISTPSKFIGAGPQVGAVFACDVTDCIQVTGKAAASLLVGSQKNHTSYKAYSPALADLNITPPNDQSTSVRSRTQVVPAIEGRLGAAYTLCLCDNINVKFEAGYEAKVFINAVQSTDIGSEVITPPVVPDTVGVFARTFHRTLSNFALAGPYISVAATF